MPAPGAHGHRVVTPWPLMRQNACRGAVIQLQRRMTAGGAWPHGGVAEGPGRVSASSARPPAAASLLPVGLGERAEPLSVMAQAVMDQPVHSVRRICAVLLPLTGWHAGQQLQALVDGPQGPHVEASLLYHLYDLVRQHQVGNVGGRDGNPLVTGEPLGSTGPEEPLDLVGHTPDRLYLAVLVD